MDLKGKRLLVVGGAGFIGSHIVDQLTETDVKEIVIYDNFFRGSMDNLKEAIVDLDVPYAVAQDNSGATWRAYRNRYWPTLYLIDKTGHIRYRHIGEGRYAETEAAIQTLLAETYP